ncbi:PREDICTED: uncharacterized protein LOC106808154 [Priapulus caudatus]|uniref:Uncharacterized protein LOC106808154 n=1 Tax=Priapulus caudatus TaxID=37621 RepID=A0ABM1E200_PRICU|nr:PREDICTED: uncharacterized protein LOC106808154 [Priapulus caudatus]
MTSSATPIAMRNNSYSMGDATPVGATVVVGVFVLLVALSGVVANTCVLISFIADKKLRKVHHVYTANQSAAELALSLLVTPLAFLLPTCTGGWIQPEALCTGWLCVAATVLLASHLAFVLVSRDRCLTAFYHTDAQRDKEALRKVLRYVGATWLLSAALITSFVVAWHHLAVVELPRVTCRPEFLGDAAFMYVVTLTEAGVVGAAVTHYTRRTFQNVVARQKTFADSNISDDADRWLTRDKTMTKALVVGASCLGALWLPLLVMMLISPLCGDCVPPLAYLLALSLYNVRSTVAPLCFAREDERLKLNVKKLLCFWRRSEVAPLLQVAP